jgi:hypothetical protein
MIDCRSVVFDLVALVKEAAAKAENHNQRELRHSNKLYER